MASVVGIELSPASVRRLFRIGWRRRSEPRIPRRAGGESLATMIESEIIPRLMLVHGLGGMPGDPPPSAPTIDATDVAAFAPLTLALEADHLLDQVELLLSRGATVETILIDLLAPAARLLGVWWEEDRCDFVEVTMGLWRLQEIVRELAARGGAPMPGDRGPQRRALFAGMPGDQHDFGSMLVGEIFHRHGWETDVAVGAGMSDLLDRIGARHYDLVGLTVSCDCHSERLTSTILALRSVSRNASVRVMVGGPVFVEDPGRAAEVGADGTAKDARQALIVAGGLVDALARSAVSCG